MPDAFEKLEPVPPETWKALQPLQVRHDAARATAIAGEEALQDVPDECPRTLMSRYASEDDAFQRTFTGCMRPQNVDIAHAKERLQEVTEEMRRRTSEKVEVSIRRGGNAEDPDVPITVTDIVSRQCGNQPVEQTLMVVRGLSTHAIFALWEQCYSESLDLRAAAERQRQAEPSDISMRLDTHARWMHDLVLGMMAILKDRLDAPAPAPALPLDGEMQAYAQSTWLRNEQAREDGPPLE